MAVVGADICWHKFPAKHTSLLVVSPLGTNTVVLR